MAREIRSRLKITGDLIAETPLHVGGYGESFETDMALARNGKDEFYIPGTSLTGSLRSWFKRNIPDDVNELWGYQDGDKGHASFVVIEDLRLPNDQQRTLRSELRDGVGIDRFYGSAADKAKFDRTILPRDTRMKFRMTVEIGYKHDPNTTKAAIKSLLEALTKSRVRLGAAKTRGLGRVKLKNCRIKEEKLNDFHSILQSIEEKNGGQPETWGKSFVDWRKIFEESLTAEEKSKLAGLINAPSLLTIKIRWKPKSPVMVKAGYDGIGVDMLPLTSGKGKDEDGDDQVSLVLPGTSIKGAFRTQAERIIRTVLDCEGKKYLTKNVTPFHEQINLPLIDELFGAKKERSSENNDPEKLKEEQRRKGLGLGALSFDDCYFGKLMNAVDWQKVETGKITKTITDKNGKPLEEDVSYTEQELWQALKKIEGDNDLVSATKEFAISHHVAIDRWTGGAADGALFSVLQPTAKIGWDEIYLTLDLSRLCDADGKPDEALRKQCLMLLLLVLRDFAENRLPLGFATNRGMGEVQRVSFETTGVYGIKWKDGEFIFADQNFNTDLEKEWQEWLRKKLNKD